MNRALPSPPSWNDRFFEKFVGRFIERGFCEDNGLAYGVYGLPFSINDEVRLIAWCYPPADPWNPVGKSKLIVRAVTPDGCKQDSFYFDSDESLQHALAKAIDYAGKFVDLPLVDTNLTEGCNV